ncbi:MAG TPA: polysaccharide biosynthesis tyrosine autokinase [Thermoanaerobaculia bacterium]|nr:polysaccharide biosynthesis tyrosine autokinase [Thermoanaerobaculia bacterium]
MKHLTPLPSLPEPGLAPEAEPEVDFNLAEYWGMVRRHWKLVAATCLTGLAAASIHYAITPPQYAASATIQIERRSLTPVGSAQNPWYENWWNMEFYPTQYELLQSRGLAERVVKNLDLMEDSELNPGAGARKDSATRPSAEDDEAVLGLLADRIRGGLAVEPVRNTQLVRLTYRSDNPDFAAKIANGFAEAFIDMGVEDRYATAGKASTFIATQIEALKEEIQDKENQLQAFSRKSDMVPLESNSSVTLQRLEAININYIESKKLRIEKESTYRELMLTPKEAIADSLAAGVVGGLRSDQIRLEREYETKLKTYKPDWPEMLTLKAEIEKGQEHLNGVITEMVEKARGGAYAAYQTALRQEQALLSELERMKTEAIDQNSSSVEFTNLKVEVETRRDLLDELLRKQSETEVAVRLQDTRESNVRIIDQALVPGGPSAPSLRKDLTYGLLLGLLLGAGCALLIEFLDRTVKSAEEIERRLGLPPLATIQDIVEAGKLYGAGYGYGYGADPAEGRSGPIKRAARATARLERKKASSPDQAAQIELVPHERPRTLISEAYRSLRTALLLSSAREIKLIAVTSAMAGEGKTATAANLAVVLAQLGRQVLIVDCDLRKPRLHQVFHVSNRFGLVNQLTSAVDPDAVFLPTEVPNLWVTPSGPIPPNPSELLASDRMREWLKTARARFDYVVVDTPPALAVTDATLVGMLVDGMVMTLRSGKVTRDEARLCRDKLRQAGIKILGAVLNRHRPLQGGIGKRYSYYESYGAEQSETKAGSAA